MYGYNPYLNRELQSDMWIQRNIPGGLNSKLNKREISRNILIYFT